jgi:hypothetical protein
LNSGAHGFCSLHGRSGKHGSLALEAALTLPVMLVLTAQMISLVMLSQAEIVLAGALDRTAAELSLVCPLGELLFGEPGIEAILPDQWIEATGKGDSTSARSDAALTTPSQLDQVLQSLWPSQDLYSMLKDAMLDFASSALLGRFIQYRLDFWLHEAGPAYRSSGKYMLGRRLFLDWSPNQDRLWLCLYYQAATPLGIINRQARSIVPIWPVRGSCKENGSADQIWQLDNFSRGKLLRQKYGANLPYDFPVIATFCQGEAISIKSADLTAPTYQQSEEVQGLILSQLERLAEFDGAIYERQNEDIEIAPAMIKSRRLILVIPENCDQAWLPECLKTMQAAALGKAISLDIIRYGCSYRNSPPAGDLKQAE